MIEPQYSKHPHKPITLVIVLTLAMVFGLGLIALSDMANMKTAHMTITGNVIKEVGKAPTTVELLQSCNVIYDDHMLFCRKAYDSDDLKSQCLDDAKDECFNCVLNSKQPTESQLKEYCYK